MPWSCIRLAAADVTGEVDSRIRSVFAAWHGRAGLPVDAAIFRENLGRDGVVLYFSPASINIAASVMAQIGLAGGPVVCERPPRTVPLYFGSADAQRRLLEG
jgi:hypothetical protein